MGWQDDPVASAATAGTPAWAADPVVKTVRNFDAINGEAVPTGSAYAKAAQSPIATPDQNSNSPVGSEISSMLSNALSGTGKAQARSVTSSAMSPPRFRHWRFQVPIP
jgi:hypothetical protein